MAKKLFFLSLQLDDPLLLLDQPPVLLREELLGKPTELKDAGMLLALGLPVGDVAPEWLAAVHVAVQATPPEFGPRSSPVGCLEDNAELGFPAVRARGAGTLFTVDFSPFT